jgi:hypothetical protein
VLDENEEKEGEEDEDEDGEMVEVGKVKNFFFNNLIPDIHSERFVE